MNVTGGLRESTALEPVGLALHLAEGGEDPLMASPSGKIPPGRDLDTYHSFFWPHSTVPRMQGNTFSEVR